MYSYGTESLPTTAIIGMFQIGSKQAFFLHLSLLLLSKEKNHQAKCIH